MPDNNKIWLKEDEGVKLIPEKEYWMKVFQICNNLLCPSGLSEKLALGTTPSEFDLAKLCQISYNESFFIKEELEKLAKKGKEFVCTCIMIYEIKMH
jgi:hypothetical protein